MSKVESCELPMCSSTMTRVAVNGLEFKKLPELRATSFAISPDYGNLN